MKTLNLEQMGVQEMDAVEMKEVDGGFIGALFAIMVVFEIGFFIGDLLAGRNEE